MPTRSRPVRFGGAAAVGALLVLGGCGGQKMSADEFVRQIRDEGVSIELGNELSTSPPGRHVYGMRLKQLAPVKPGQEAFTHGSISVFDDTGGADGGLAQCRITGLACYQAANIVVALEGNGIEARQLAVAIEKLGG